MSTVLIPGSFDPPTLGHLDIIQRATTITHKVVVGVAQNAAKKGTFTIEERIALLKKVLKGEKKVEIVPIEGLAVEFAKKKGCDFLLRGLRTFRDMEAEFQMALANKKISGLETLFLMADNRFAHISSTLIREIVAAGHDLKEFLPSEIEHDVFDRLRN